MQAAKAPAEARWSRNAIASIVALFICVPIAPVLALLAFRDCAQTPGMKGRELAFVARLPSLASLTLMGYVLARVLSGGVTTARSGRGAGPDLRAYSAL